MKTPPCRDAFYDAFEETEGDGTSDGRPLYAYHDITICGGIQRLFSPKNRGMRGSKMRMIQRLGVPCARRRRERARKQPDVTAAPTAMDATICTAFSPSEAASIPLFSTRASIAL